MARLRILETTDLHMQLLAYDYFADRVADRVGLIRFADSISALRDDGVGCLLFDNGDFLQGNPLADFIAAQGLSDQPHPMIAVMNGLAYDAITLGNHEFNYGLPFLEQTLAGADFPVVCANVRRSTGGSLVPPFTMIDRVLTCDDGQDRKLRIGVIGVVTPQIMDWDKALLDGKIETDDIIEAASAQIPVMKAAGADIIVALCHSGIGADNHTARMENAAVPLAALPGIDVVLTGHTHEVFPGDSRNPTGVVDPVAGTLHSKPTAMAGFYGGYLGVIDLTLDWHDDAWHVAEHAVRLDRGRPPAKHQSKLEKTLTAHVRDAHVATLAHIRQPIARTAVPIHSYFATIAADHTQELLARAQQAAMTDALSDTPYAALPVLSATAPFRYGGRAGPGHYIDIAPGALTIRDAAAIYPFTNTLCAMQRTGAQLRDWLERAASHFLQIMPGLQDQPLIDPHSAAYNCDTIYGLTYEIDLTQPARFDPEGLRVNPDACRVQNLACRGDPVADDDIFVVATNGYRANGGGGFARIPDMDVLYTSARMTRDILIDHLVALGSVGGGAIGTWRFAATPDTSVIFQSAPAARAHMTPDMARLGPGADGFDRYRLML